VRSGWSSGGENDFEDGREAERACYIPIFSPQGLCVAIMVLTVKSCIISYSLL
jgi:hypothetical protein